MMLSFFTHYHSCVCVCLFSTTLFPLPFLYQHNNYINKGPDGWGHSELSSGDAGMCTSWHAADKSGVKPR